MADYNINAVTRRVVFSGSAGTGPYAFSFEVLVSSDIVVYFNATKLTLTTDYSVSVASNGTGAVTIVVGGSARVPETPDSNDTITIVGARDIKRTTDFVTAGDLLAASLNEQLDGLTIFDQQIAEEQKRSLMAPVYDPAHADDGGNLDMTLPAKAARLGKTLAFNSSTGNPEAGPTTASIANAETFATNASNSASAASGSASAASSSASAASTSASEASASAASVSPATLVAKTSTTGAAKIPVGTTAQRDGSPATGYFRYNSTETQFEGYDGSAWGQIGGGAGYFKGDNGTVGSSPGDIFRINEAELNTNVTITSAENASATGPLTIASSKTLTVEGVLVIL